MGHGEQTPLTFFIKNPHTGEMVEVPREVAEVTLSLCDGEDSTPRGCCYGCDHSDGTRRQGDKIRCKRWSQWVDPMKECCPECTFSVSGTLTEEMKNKIKELLGE